MRNAILNVTGTGSFIELGAGNGFPQHTFAMKMQARTADDFTYRFRGQTNVWTVKSGQVSILKGKFDPGDFQVNSAVGVVVEIEVATQGQSEFA